MLPETRDKAYLWDMLEAAREIMSFPGKATYLEFEGNHMLRYAVERLLLVIGEAANHVSTAFQDSHPGIPWRQLVGLRNVLAHEYGEIKVERIYNTTTNSIPELVEQLAQIVLL